MPRLQPSLGWHDRIRRIERLALALLLAAFAQACGAPEATPGASGPARDRAAASGPGERPAPGTVNLVSIAPIEWREEVVQGEDFSQELGTCLWKLPEGARQVTTGGVEYMTEKGGPGPRFGAAPFDAATVELVRITLSAMRGVQEVYEPVAIPWAAFFWARESDVTGKGWPFHNERSVEFVKVAEGKDPHVYEAALEEHPGWNGRIIGAYIDLNFSKDPQLFKTESPPAFKVHVEKIELLASKPVTK